MPAILIFVYSLSVGFLVGLSCSALYICAVRTSITRWIVAIIRDVYCAVYVIVDSIFCWTKYDKPIIVNEHTTGNPILLVHGSTSSQSNWVDAVLYIKKYMPGNPTYAFSMDLHFDEDTEKQYLSSSDLYPASGNYLQMRRHSSNADRDIFHYANVLHKHVEYLYSKYNKQIILIGMSMGGLTSNYYASSLGFGYVKAVASISSPIRGTPRLDLKLVKRVLNTKRHKQMTSNSDFLKELYLALRRTKPIYRLTIGSEQDIHVPEEYSKFPDEFYTDAAYYTHYRIAGYGHLAIASSDDVWRYIAEWVGKISKLVN